MLRPSHLHKDVIPCRKVGEEREARRRGEECKKGREEKRRGVQERKRGEECKKGREEKRRREERRRGKENVILILQRIKKITYRMELALKFIPNNKHYMKPEGCTLAGGKREISKLLQEQIILRRISFFSPQILPQLLQAQATLPLWVSYTANLPLEVK